MSTMNVGCALSLDEDSEQLSVVSSLRIDSVRKESLEQVLGRKSESDVKMESEAKQEKIDHLVTISEKVICSGLVLNFCVYGINYPIIIIYYITKSLAEENFNFFN